MLGVSTHNSSSWAGTQDGREPLQLGRSKGLALSRGLVAVLISAETREEGSTGQAQNGISKPSG